MKICELMESMDALAVAWCEAVVAEANAKQAELKARKAYSDSMVYLFELQDADPEKFHITDVFDSNKSCPNCGANR